VLFDSIGSYGLTEDFLAPLRRDGVELLEFHPIAPWRTRWGLNRRNHKKLLIVDDEIGFIGGINIGDVYAPLEDGGGGWFDVHSVCVGPVVADLARSFRRTWIAAGGDHFELANPAAEREPEAGSLARAIDNYGLGERSRMRAAYVFAIRNAGARISLMNPYFIPDRGLRRAFRLAARRGVAVRIIVPAHSDVRVVQLASRHLYPRLLRGGVRVFEWTGHMMHAKTAVIDSLWSTIGSYNIDKRSFLHNFEASVVVLDRDFALRLEKRFDADLERCREVSLQECLGRPLWERVLQWTCFRFRYWL
jgi:cardiolipin synthase